MKLKVEIIERIKGRSDIKRNLVNASKLNRYSVWRWLNDNEEDGPLTKIKFLEIISEGLNLTIPELLNDCTVEISALQN